MIFITGDMHGDRSRFKEVKKAGIRKGDTLIVCGDFGFIWNGGRDEERLLKWIGSRRYHVLFVDGAHENHMLLKKYPVEEAFGGQVRRISGKLCELLRGEVFLIEGKKVFAFGGGNSLERYSRPEEEAFCQPTAEEMDTAIKNLSRVGNQVDLVITHDAPAKIHQFIQIESREELTNLQMFLEEISRSIKYRRWFFGKYHGNKPVPPYFNMVFTAVQPYKD